MKVTIHQPDFLRWLGFFERWATSDLYIALDDVQFLRRGWHHRDKIKTPNGPQWLTVPVQKKGSFDQSISDVELDNSTSWREKHLKTLRCAYGHAPQFDRLFTRLERIYQKGQSRLLDFNLSLLEMFAEEFNITTPVVLSSSLGVNAKATEKLVRLTQEVGGTAYYTGTGCKAYLDESMFDHNGIELLYQDFQHPEYEQVHGEFIPMLSSIDYLMMLDGDLPCMIFKQDN